MIEDLYDLIGGRSTVEAATELFYNKILQDDSLRHFFERVEMAHLAPGRPCSFPCFLADGYIQGKIFMTLMPNPEITV